MATKQRRFYGEEAQRVSLKDCQAAYMTIAKLRAGQLDLSDIMEEAPKRGEITATVTDTACR